MAPSRGFISLSISTVYPTSCSKRFVRSFAASAVRDSGHNRWSKIRHDKGKNDANRNRQSSFFSKEIASASKLFGPEPSMNPRLADIITKAKREGFAKASIEAAIARGQGRSLSGATLESVTVEGMLPGNVGVIVECETDSRLRTLAAVRLAMKDAGGSATPSSFLFEKRGRITLEEKDGVGVDEVFEAALEAGATDVEDSKEGTNVTIYCEPGNTKAVGQAIANALNVQIETSEIIWCPNNDTRVGVPDEDMARSLAAFVDDLQQKETSISGVAMNVAQGNVNNEVWRDLQSRLAP